MKREHRSREEVNIVRDNQARLSYIWRVKTDRQQIKLLWSSVLWSAHDITAATPKQLKHNEATKPELHYPTLINFKDMARREMRDNTNYCNQL